MTWLYCLPVFCLFMIGSFAVAETVPLSSEKRTVTTSAHLTDFAVFCRTGHDEYRRVIEHDKKGLKLLPGTISFKEAWNCDLQVSSPVNTQELETVTWAKLSLPLPESDIATWGYAMTYPAHQEEVRLEDSFHFRKFSSATSGDNGIVFRPYLDYEAEVALLMLRSDSSRFGYLLANDLTDREIQARTFDANNMGPGFSKAKSFPGALHVGLLLVIGGADLWEKLEIELLVNGEKRQHLKARDCLLRPPQVHGEIFSEKDAGQWVLVATGTTDGVQFRRPSIWQKVGLILSSGLSKEKATRRWLESLTFLQPGDRVELNSAILGRSLASIVAD